jgi:response regulator NasT
MVVSELEHLRVLIANEQRERVDLLTDVVTGLGHRVIACEAGIEGVAQVTVQERPDVALIGLGVSSDAALELIERIVHESACPVIAMLSVDEPGYVREAARRGVFAYIVDSALDDLQGTLDITLQRFAEYHSLQGAFGRRAIIEQAKGILMARHAIDADAAFAMLRAHSQSRGRKVGDVAGAIVDSHVLLMARPLTD